MTPKPSLRLVREPTPLANQLNAYKRGYDRGLAEGRVSFRIRAWAQRVLRAAGERLKETA